jgi:hypothetical protein
MKKKLTCDYSNCQYRTVEFSIMNIVGLEFLPIIFTLFGRTVFCTICASCLAQRENRQRQMDAPSVNNLMSLFLGNMSQFIFKGVSTQYVFSRFFL